MTSCSRQSTCSSSGKIYRSSQGHLWSMSPRSHSHTGSSSVSTQAKGRTLRKGLSRRKRKGIQWVSSSGSTLVGAHSGWSIQSLRGSTQAEVWWTLTARGAWKRTWRTMARGHPCPRSVSTPARGSQKGHVGPGVPVTKSASFWGSWVTWTRARGPRRSGSTQGGEPIGLGSPWKHKPHILGVELGSAGSEPCVPQVSELPSPSLDPDCTSEPFLQGCDCQPRRESPCCPHLSPFLLCHLRSPHREKVPRCPCPVPILYCM